MEISKNARLRELREKLLLTQNQMAIELGLSQSYYSDIENDRRTLSNKLIKKLSENLMVSTEWITTGKGDMISDKRVNKVSPISVPSLSQRTKNNNYEHDKMIKSDVPLDFKKQIDKAMGINHKN